MPLSVVIPSHNRPDLLRRCLASLARHAPRGTEVLVIDDGSTGACVSVAAGEFPGVRLLRHERAGGFCAAANAGLHAASRPIVELLNDDTEVTTGWAESALVHFRQPGVAAVAPLVLLGPVDQRAPRVDSAGDRYYLGGIASKRGHGRLLGPEHLRAGTVFGASACAAFYDRAAVLAVGGFPEELGAYFEDVDLAFRLHWAGHRVVYEPACRVWHHGASSHGPCRGALLAQQARNEEWVFWRNLPTSLLARALPRHLAVLVAKAVRRWREGAFRPWLLGKLRVLGQWRAILRHRLHLQARWADADPSGWGIDTTLWCQAPAAHTTSSQEEEKSCNRWSAF